MTNPNDPIVLASYNDDDGMRYTLSVLAQYRDRWIVRVEDTECPDGEPLPATLYRDHGAARRHFEALVAEVKQRARTGDDPTTAKRCDHCGGPGPGPVAVDAHTMKPCETCGW